jgi:hypothetical protein
MRTFTIAALFAYLTGAQEVEEENEKWEFRYIGKNWHNWDAKYKHMRIMDDLREDMTGAEDYLWKDLPDLFR